MRPTRLAVAIALIAGTVSFNAAAQSAPSAQDIAELKAQIAALQARLAAEQAAGALAWGMHSSREALITCLVESHAGRHLHFVDGSDGGYALAARQLKTQLAAARPPQALS